VLNHIVIAIRPVKLTEEGLNRMKVFD